MASSGLSHCLSVLPLSASGLGEASLVLSYLSQVSVELSEEVLHAATVHSNKESFQPCAALEQWT